MTLSWWNFSYASRVDSSHDLMMMMAAMMSSLCQMGAYWRGYSSAQIRHLRRLGMSRRNDWLQVDLVGGLGGQENDTKV